MPALSDWVCAASNSRDNSVLQASQCASTETLMIRWSVWETASVVSWCTFFPPIAYKRLTASNLTSKDECRTCYSDGVLLDAYLCRSDGWVCATTMCLTWWFKSLPHYLLQRKQSKQKRRCQVSTWYAAVRQSLQLVYWKSICDFLLLINSKLGPISHRFATIHACPRRRTTIVL